jgi:hypothetical protein
VDNYFLLIGAFGAILGALYMIWAAIRDPFLWKAARSVYILAGALDLYLAIIYIMVLTNVLCISSYGDFVRPVLFPIVTAPAIIAFLHRRNKNGRSS